ncbi:long-chain-fatty-acid--CoA ligase [Sphingobium subterraneum]|uniref:Long-chain acyl-CoA synthetase n=1 Tax=Sphingobium subterraneum TaxID=627688 RepID=A0A841J6F5_9SPHN|nr:long-chain fatty acid--CoA ligase [Sphingobium subterraneum]MBB6123791.1 long-chain acyl-CoA synthetase [Sphingobium subterraneum]
MSRSERSAPVSDPREPGEPRLLPDLLAQSARRSPESVALDFMGRSMSYAGLAARVERVARALQDLGLAPGDRMCLCLPNTSYFVILYFAVLRAGGIVVAMNPLYTEREMGHVLADSGARLLAVPDDRDIHAKASAAAGAAGVRRIIVCPIAAALPPIKGIAYRFLARRSILRVPNDEFHLPYRMLERATGRPADRARDPGDVAVLQYTGGTTGVPKGAMLTHASLIANALQMRDHDRGLPSTPERVIGVLPMFHVFALTTVLNYSILTGAEIVLLPRFELDSFLKTMARTRPHRLFAVPTLIGKLNEHIGPHTPGFKRLRCCISGGAPLPPEMLAQFERHTGIVLSEGYGLSEASPIVASNSLTEKGRVGSVGRPFPRTTIELRDLDDLSRTVPAGAAGEVWVSGPQVMRGYWNRPEESAEVLRDGFLRTGDVGRFDADGFLFLVDRIKDLILCGGYNVYPRVIEDALYEHEDVLEVTVIGVPDPYRGEAPKAFVRKRPGSAATADDLRAFLTSRISKIEMPRDIEFRDELPKTLIGKLSKKELRGD